MMRQPTRGLLGWGFRIAGSALLLWLVARKLELPALRQLLLSVHWGWIVASFGVMLAGRVLSCTRLILLMRATGVTFTPKAVAQIVLASEFYGSFLPASLGGDAIRVWSLARHTNETAESASAVLVERVCGAVALLLLGCAGAFWAWPRLADHRIVWAGLVPSCAGLAVLVAALNERWVSATIRWMGLHRHRAAVKLLEWHAAVLAWRHHRRAVAEVLALSLVIQGLRVTSVYLVGLAFGAATPFGYFAALVPLILLVSMLPISIGGLGVRENGFVYGFGQVGMAPAPAFAISLMAHVLSVLAHLPGGFWSIWGLGGAVRGGERTASHRPLRVLWVADKLQYGAWMHGVGHYYLTAIPRLAGVEVIPTVLRSADGLAGTFRAQGIEVRELHAGRFDLGVVWTLMRWIRAERIDALHVHGYGASAIGRVVGWLARTPVIVHQHEGWMPPPWTARVSDRLLRGATTRMLAVSESVKRFCTTERCMRPDRVTVLPMGIAPPRLLAGEALESRRLELGLPAGARVIGSITRFHPIKGVRFLIEAMPDIVHAVPNAHLVLWGDGPEHDALAARAKTLGVASQVHFAGYRTDAAQTLGLVECFVLPSLSEGSPLALLEALAAGRAVVATRVGGVPEVIRDGEGLLVPPKDPAALAEAIIRVLTDNALAQRLRTAARQASERYSVERHLETLRRVYAEVLR